MGNKKDKNPGIPMSSSSSVVSLNTLPETSSQAPSNANALSQATNSAFESEDNQNQMPSYAGIPYDQSNVSNPSLSSNPNVEGSHPDTPMYSRSTHRRIPSVTTENITPQIHNRSNSLRSTMFNRNARLSTSEPKYENIESANHNDQDSSTPGTYFGPNSMDIRQEHIFPYDSASTNQSVNTGQGQHNPHHKETSQMPDRSPTFYNDPSTKNPTNFKQKLQDVGVRGRFKTAISKTRDFILRVKRPPPSKGGRVIPVGIENDRPLLIDNRTNKPYCDNLITSSIYTYYNFLPRQLVAQFSKLANV